MPSFSEFKTLLLTCVCTTLLTSSAFASNAGFDSAEGIDLPLSAGGTLGLTIEHGTGRITTSSSLQLSKDTSACTSSLAGSIRWSGTKFEGCDGAGTWKTLGDGVPTGQVSWFAGACPDDYLEANGNVVSSATYPTLAAYLDSSFGVYGQLPDLRGVFIRGLDLGRGMDTNETIRTLGSYQVDTVGPHSHQMRSYPLNTTGGSGAGAMLDFSVTWMPLVTSSINSGEETRPRNVALMPCVKY